MDIVLHIYSLVDRLYYLEVTKNNYLLSYFAKRGDSIRKDGWVWCERAILVVKILGRSDN